MKKILILLVLFTLVVAGSAYGAISSTKHNLTLGGGQTVKASTTTLSLCQYCHTPHLRGYPTVTGAPLWNRSLPAGSYTLYDSNGASSGNTQAGTSIAQPGNESKTCLSCHDGQISVGEVLVGTSATIAAVASRVGADGKLLNDADNTTPNYLIGTDLGQEHPIGIIYNDTSTKAGLTTAVDVTAPYKITGTEYRLYGGGNATGKVECASCHGAHDNTNGSFLRGAKGTHCTDCHATK